MKPESPGADADRISELWESYLRGTLDNDGASFLLRWLKSHPEELHARQKEAAVNGALSYLVASNASTTRLVDSVQSRLEGKVPGRDSNRFARQVMQSLPPRAARHGRAVRSRLSRGSKDAQLYWIVAAFVAIALIAYVVFTQQPKANKETLVQTKEPSIPVSPVPEIRAPAAALVRARKGILRVDEKTLSEGPAWDLNPGSTVQVTEAAEGSVTLLDGSKMELGANSTLKLLTPEKGTRLELTRGRVTVHANPQKDGNRIQIRTMFTTVSVVGTEYTVDAFDNLSRVLVKEGRVGVASNQKTDDAEKFVSANQEVLADAAGVGAVHTISPRREYSSSGVTAEVFADPVRISDIAGEEYQEMPIRKMRYDRPRNGQGFGGVSWAVNLAPDEDHCEIWIRPKWVKPDKAEFLVAKAVLLAQEENSEYLLGVAVLPAGESHEWVQIKGVVSNGAVLRWTDPNLPKQPFKPELIKHIALRTEIGEMELDFTPLVIYRR